MAHEFAFERLRVWERNESQAREIRVMIEGLSAGITALRSSQARRHTHDPKL